jgi:hypothetical protein
VQCEQVQPGTAQVRLTLAAGGHADRLDGVDPKRLDDGPKLLHHDGP